MLLINCRLYHFHFLFYCCNTTSLVRSIKYLFLSIIKSIILMHFISKHLHIPSSPSHPSCFYILQIMYTHIHTWQWHWLNLLHLFFFLAVLLVLAVSVLFPAQILTSMPLLPILMMLEKVLKQKWSLSLLFINVYKQKKICPLNYFW